VSGGTDVIDRIVEQNVAPRAARGARRRIDNPREVRDDARKQGLQEGIGVWSTERE
jgi:hypothetical protein